MFYLVVLEPTADDPSAEKLIRAVDGDAQPLSDTAWAVWRRGDGATAEIARELRDVAPHAIIIVASVSAAAAINPFSPPPPEWGGRWVLPPDHP